MDDIVSMEVRIAKFLRAGVVVSGIFITIGWLWSFKSDYDPFAPLQSYSPLSLMDSLEVSFMLKYWGRIVSYIGLIILISLPVLRVFLSVILFIKQKEKTMALIGAIVLIGLILSFSLGV